MAKNIDLTKDLTAVIITYNRSGELTRTLEHLCDVPEEFNMIVVDNASTDGTCDLIRNQFPQVKYLRLNENRYAEARNVGAEAAETPFVAFTDDDCWWEAGSLDLAVATLSRYPKVAALAPQVLVYGKKQDPLNRYFGTSPLPAFVDMPGPSLMGFLEGSVVMRKDAFLSTGGYDSALKIHGEGRRVAIQLVDEGWGITYHPEAIAYHYPSRTRNAADQLRSAARNNILTAALAEPWENVVLEIGSSLRDSWDHPIILVGMLEGLAKIPAVIGRRKRISPRMRGYFELLREQKRRLMGLDGKVYSC